MAIVDTLRNKADTTVYPRTVAEAVYMNDGTNATLKDKMNQVDTNISTANTNLSDIKSSLTELNSLVNQVIAANS